MTQEKALLSKDNKSQFFRYVNSRLGKKQSQPILVSNSVELTTDDAVEAFSAEFARNFIIKHPKGSSLTSMSHASQCLHLNCTATDIRVALAQCPNTAAGPDGVSFAILKAVSDVIMLPLLVIFQQSLSQGKFPSS
jgi:hypothetical protein